MTPLVWTAIAVFTAVWMLRFRKIARDLRRRWQTVIPPQPGDSDWEGE